MISIRKFWWAGLALAAVVGCAEQPPAAPSGTAPTASPGPAPTMPPGSPAPAKPDAAEPAKPDAKAGDTKDMEKPDSAPALPKVEGPKIDAPKPDADSKGASVQLKDKEIVAIKELPADEQETALKQLVCPVSKGHLGAMGKPFKVTAEGKTFYLCCDGCKEEVDSNPKAVLAKLKN